jgi:hypothetical protein
MRGFSLLVDIVARDIPLYYIYSANSILIRAVLGFFLSLGGRLLVDYIYI